MAAGRQNAYVRRVRQMLRSGRRLLLTLAIFAVLATLVPPVFAVAKMTSAAVPCHPATAAQAHGGANMGTPAHSDSRTVPTAHPCCSLICLVAAPAVRGLDLAPPQRLGGWDTPPARPLAGLAAATPDPPPRPIS